MGTQILMDLGESPKGPLGRRSGLAAQAISGVPGHQLTYFKCAGSTGTNDDNGRDSEVTDDAFNRFVD